MNNTKTALNWTKKEYSNQMKRINEILKNHNGKFENNEEKEEVFGFADISLNKKMQGIIDFDILCNRIIFLETQAWKMYFVVDKKGIVRGYKQEEEQAIDLKWERKELNPYYNITFALDVEELSNYLYVEYELLEIYFNTIRNNLSNSFNKSNVQIRLKKDFTELNLSLEHTSLGEEIKITTLDGNEKLLIVDNDILTKETYEKILRTFDEDLVTN